MKEIVAHATAIITNAVTAIMRATEARQAFVHTD
jgi:hypothetical protein